MALGRGGASARHDARARRFAKPREGAPRIVRGETQHMGNDRQPMILEKGQAVGLVQ